MAKVSPLFVTERNAAALLDMPPREFRDLVAQGALPGAARHGRWDVEELTRIMRGEQVGGLGVVDWS